MLEDQPSLISTPDTNKPIRPMLMANPVPNRGKSHQFAGNFVGNWGDKGIPYAHAEPLDSWRENPPPLSAAI
jgi:hypothetical protein